jgi:hypothetical protein
MSASDAANAVRASLIASDTSIEAALEPVKLFECIGKRGCHIGSRFAVQPLCLDEPSTSGRIQEGTSKVPSGLGVVVRVLPTGGLTSSDSQPSESDVVHDHIRLRQHQIVAVACIVIDIPARHVKHAGTTEGGETVGGSSCGSQLGTGGRAAEMISDRCSDANRQVLIKGVGENLLPTAQAGGLWRPGPPVAAPSTQNRHIDLRGHLIPGQALVTQLQDLLCGGGMSGRTAATHGDAGVELGPHGIRVVTVCPEAVATPINQSTMDDPAKLKKLQDAIPLRRLAQPDDIADVVVFLASGRNDYVTATSVFLDGGIMQGSVGLGSVKDGAVRLKAPAVVWCERPQQSGILPKGTVDPDHTHRSVPRLSCLYCACTAYRLLENRC